MIVVFSAATEYGLKSVLYCELKEGSKGESVKEKENLHLFQLLEYKYIFSFYTGVKSCQVQIP